MTKAIVIHRDRTFEYKGKRYQVLGAHASTGNCYELADMEFNGMAGQDWNSMADLRKWLEQTVAGDYDILTDEEAKAEWRKQEYGAA